MTHFLLLQELDLPSTSSESIFHILQLLLGFALNIVAVLLLILGLYYRKQQHKNQAFTLVIANLCVFLLSYMTTDLLFSGLFAASILVGLSFNRYSQEEGLGRELTFAIVVIALGLLNAQIGIVGYIELAVANLLLVFSFFIFHHFWQKNVYQSQLLQWYRPNLLKPQNRQLLLKELYQLTGLNVVDVKVEQVDWEHQTALLKIYYPDTPFISTTVEQNGQFIEQELPPIREEVTAPRSQFEEDLFSNSSKSHKKIVLKQGGNIANEDI